MADSKQAILAGVVGRLRGQSVEAKAKTEASAKKVTAGPETDLLNRMHQLCGSPGQVVHGAEDHSVWYFATKGRPPASIATGIKALLKQSGPAADVQAKNFQTPMGDVIAVVEMQDEDNGFNVNLFVTPQVAILEYVPM